METRDRARGVPFFGCLTRPPAGVPLSGTFAYHRRGTLVAFPPDLVPEPGTESGDLPFGRGRLFRCEGAAGPEAPVGPGGPVGWSAASVLDFAVDVALRFDTDDEVFVDRVLFRQVAAEGSRLAGVTVFREVEAGGLEAVARIEAGPSRQIGDEELHAVVGLPAKRLVLRLEGCYRPIVLSELAVYGATLAGPVVYPLPRLREAPAGRPLRLADMRAISCEPAGSTEALFAARVLAEKLAEELGVRLELRDTVGATEPRIRLELGSAGGEAGPEQYSVEVDAGRVLIRSPSRRGLLWGAETFFSLARQGGSGHTVAPCRIEDSPALELRGVHMGLPPREEIPFFKRLVRYLLAPMRYNTLFLELAGGMELERRPEINRAWVAANERGERGEAPPLPHGSMVAGGRCLTKAEVRDLVAYARDYGLEVIPEVQSLSHVQYLTITYPEIAELSPRPAATTELSESADKSPDELYPHCYCPSLEESYRITFDLIDEIVDVVRPERFVHMGHDEVYTIGACERCRDKDPAELFARHVTRVRDYLAARGLRMMIWSDMLQSVTSYRTPPAADRIPRDVVLLDFIWYFHLDRDIEDSLLDRGFPVAMGNLYSSHYPRYEARRRKAGIIGGEVSTWVRVDERTLGYEGKIYDFLYSANMLWSDEYREDLRRSFDRVLTGLIPGLRARLRGAAFPSLEPEARFVPLTLPGVGRSPAFDRVLQPGSVVLRGVPFHAAEGPLVLSPSREQVRIPVGERLDSLLFLHASGANAPRVPWAPLTIIGEYEVVYQDGRTLSVPVEYGGCIAPLERPHALPMASPLYRHQGYVGTYFADPFVTGKDDRGDDRTVYGYEWLNPEPGRKIREIRAAARDVGVECPILLFAVTGVRRAGGH